MFHYSINPDSEIPVYRQLADQINAEIRSGALKAGTQLPTVREMAEGMHLSCGTVKRVYDRLRELGDIEMTRRRGSFVKYVREDGDSRKLQAMTAIDRMIRSLSDLNFSPAEIQIFLNLKMREWGLKWSGVRIALVTEYTEFSAALERELQGVGNVQVIICGLRQFREYPYSIDEQSDVILASPQDSQQLMPILPDRSKLIKLAFGPDADSLCRLARAGGKLGLICEGEALPRLIKGYLMREQKALLRVYNLSSEDDFEGFLEGVDALIFPEGWERDCPAHILARIEEKMGEKLLPFRYGVDEGSMIYLEERINRIREERQLKPGMLRF